MERKSSRRKEKELRTVKEVKVVQQRLRHCLKDNLKRAKIMIWEVSKHGIERLANKKRLADIGNGLETLLAHKKSDVP